jgi:hypothetical protein
MQAAENTGKGLLTLAVAMLLSIGTAILGALLAFKTLFGDREPVVEVRHHHTTAPYPVTTPER